MTQLENIKIDLIGLGIIKGDTVFIRGDLGAIGRIRDRNLLINAVLDVVGETGTIVTLGFTKFFPFYKVNKNYIYKQDILPETGALAKTFHKHKSVKRSKHPTNSFYSIGKNAEMIINDHNANSSAYKPIEALIQLNAKMIIFGIISTSPGFTTVHYAQEKLGLTSKSILKNLLQVHYIDQENIKLYKKSDIGGCSLGFHKFYKHYLDSGKMNVGYVGNATAISMPAKTAYEIEYQLLSDDPTYHFCDSSTCLSCRASWTYSLSSLPKYLIVKSISFIRSKIIQRK